MAEEVDILTIGRIGIFAFMINYLLSAGIALYKLNGTELILNFSIYGSLALTFLICVYFFWEHSSKALKVSISISGFDSLLYFYSKIPQLLDFEGIAGTIVSLVLMAVRLTALWAIWNAWRHMESI